MSHIAAQGGFVYPGGSEPSLFYMRTHGMQDLVTVFGGSGFIGTQIVRALAKQGLRIRVAVRQPHLAHTMRLMGDVGQVEVVQANIRDEASVRRALSGAHAAVNAVGILYETGRQKFQAVHVDGARTVAKAARDLGVERLVQISAIGADQASSSDYARTKGEGEAAVREAFPDAVILRPSVAFGQGDGLFEKFAEMAVFSPALPLIGGGETKFQPVYVGDVAAVVAKAVSSPAAEGLTYELDSQANVIWGARVLPTFEGRCRVMAIMTGITSVQAETPAATNMVNFTTKTASAPTRPAARGYQMERPTSLAHQKTQRMTGSGLDIIE